MNPTRSSQMRLPGLGALGCMSCEGFSFSEVRQVAQVTSAVPTSATANTMSANHGLNARMSSGSVYSEPYACQKMEGSRLNPMRIPATQPMMLARQQ